MPIGRVRSTDTPTSRIRVTDTPRGHLGQRGFFIPDTFSITSGMPIGLLLTLTYAENHSGNRFAGEAPKYIRIRSTD